MKNEIFERELQNTSINDVSLAEYVKENYLPISVLDKIMAEIEENINYNKKMKYQGIVAGLLLTLDIIDKYRESEE